jgi:hypothetical protein
MDIFTVDQHDVLLQSRRKEQIVAVVGQLSIRQPEGETAAYTHAVAPQHLQLAEKGRV